LGEVHVTEKQFHCFMAIGSLTTNFAMYGCHWWPGISRYWLVSSN